MNPEKPSKEIEYPEISAELKAMADVDQEMRGRAEKDTNNFDPEVDKKNTKRMKEVVKRIEWPTISKVGEEGMQNAWLLVQHADHDVEFQKKCLELMKQEPEEEVDQKRIAFLEDRVRRGEGLPQLYGTQFIQKDGKFVPQIMDDKEKINERRAELGMGTLEERTKIMNERYGASESS